MIRLLSYDLDRLEALALDPTSVDGIPVVDDGLPPHFIVAHAETALRAGRPALWFAPFAFVDTIAGHIVGSGIFKGEPDDGWVEIGYGVAASHRGRGHATAAVRALCALAFAQPTVTAVYAETEIDNVASRRVVEKNGFTHAGRRDSEDHGRVDCWFVER